MRRALVGLALLGLLVALAAPTLPATAAPLLLTFDFEAGPDGWQVGFADYHLEHEADYDLVGRWERLPAPYDGHGVFVAGDNRSDDLFMYLKRRVSGLQPRTWYDLAFRIDLLSNAPSGCLGPGEPGEGVTLKVGATSFEPLAFPDALGLLRMNIDKSNQVGSGRDAIAIGHIGNGSPDCSSRVFLPISREHPAQPFRVRTDADGALWLIVGTDSGFEGSTSLFYRQIRVEAMAVPSFQSFAPAVAARP